MIFDPILDIFRGKAITIPPMDGALKPNTALDESEIVLEADAPDNLCSYHGGLLYASGHKIFVLEGGGAAPREISQFEAPVSALATSVHGDIAIGLDNGEIGVIKTGGDTVELKAPPGLACPTALAFDASGALYVAQGSAQNRPSDWVVDLMESGASGSVWRHDPNGGTDPVCLAKGLAFPYGLLVHGDGRSLAISESWRHRLVRVSTETPGTPTPIVTKLAGYPARMAPAGDGGAWLALFAPRNRLIEFVLQEDAYRRDMLRDVPRAYWIAPALSSNESFLEPLQCGGVKTMGIHKPWSPSLSYGLVVRLDRDLRPMTSFHSRANGRRHGVTSVVEAGDRVLAASKGGHVILDIGPAMGQRD